MASIFLIQLVGIVMTIAGFIALTASAHLFGRPMSPAEKQRASDEWNRRKRVLRLPLTLETIVASIIFLGGVGVLLWADFDLCTFLAFWLPSLPQAARLVLSCQ